MSQYSEVIVNLKKMVPDNIMEDPILSQVADDFLCEIPVTLKNVEGYLKEGNVSEAMRFAHQIKGSAGTFGLFSLGNMAKVVEDACREGEPIPTIEEHLKKLFDAIGLT